MAPSTRNNGGKSGDKPHVNNKKRKTRSSLKSLIVFHSSDSEDSDENLFSSDSEENSNNSDSDWTPGLCSKNGSKRGSNNGRKKRKINFVSNVILNKNDVESPESDDSDTEGGSGSECSDDQNDDDNEKKNNEKEVKNIAELVLNSIIASSSSRVNLSQTENSGAATRRNSNTSQQAFVPSKIEPPIQPNTFDKLLQLARNTVLESKQSNKDVVVQEKYIDCMLLPKILPHLEELDELTGLVQAKQMVTDWVVFKLQKNLPQPSLGHIVIHGGPGVGKTTFANILAKILKECGTLSTGKVVTATSQNLIAEYLGQTASKASKLIQQAFGGVLLIDEASSLSDGRCSASGDSFSKQAIDTLNRMLTEHADKFICVLAGYKEEIQRDFFNVNPGLARRFTTFFNMEPYSAKEMSLIAEKKLKNLGFYQLKEKNDCKTPNNKPTEQVDLVSCPVKVDEKFFKDVSLYKNCAGDVHSFVDKILLAHSRLSFGKTEKFCLAQGTVEKGFDLFKEYKMSQRSERETINRDLFHSMYT